MTTKEFIAALRNAPQNQLIFENGIGEAIHAGYHLTEIKAAHFETLDCGGQTDRWDETVVQLWVPGNADDDYMTAGKFLNIFDRVSSMISLQFKTEIRIEYGDENFFPSLYHVDSVRSTDGETRVVLTPPATTCKARDRRLTKVEVEPCCEAACC